MSLKLELTAEQEAKLNREAHAAGIPPAEYLGRLIDATLPAHTGIFPGETLFDACVRTGAVGAVEGSARADGRPWSEIEGYDLE